MKAVRRDGVSIREKNLFYQGKLDESIDKKIGLLITVGGFSVIIILFLIKKRELSVEISTIISVILMSYLLTLKRYLKKQKENDLVICEKGILLGDRLIKTEEIDYVSLKLYFVKRNVSAYFPLLILKSGEEVPIPKEVRGMNNKRFERGLLKYKHKAGKSDPTKKATLCRQRETIAKNERGR